MCSRPFLHGCNMACRGSAWEHPAFPRSAFWPVRRVLSGDGSGIPGAHQSCIRLATSCVVLMAAIRAEDSRTSARERAHGAHTETEHSASRRHPRLGEAGMLVAQE